MSDEERLIVALEARVKDFERKMERAERKASKNYLDMRRNSKSATRAMERDMVHSTNRINQALAATSTKIGMLGKAFAAGAIATGMTAITIGAGRAVRSMADLGDAAKRAGMNVEAFQEWRFVAEQNRISIDALTDGVKELNLRADEFILTGAGPAKEAFERLGFSASDLKRKLKDPSALMLELIGRMKGLDRAGRIRVADEIFGGTAGERFVELVDLGSDGIQSLIDKARETGVVLDAEVIDKAVELDRRFAELRARTDTLFKGMVIGAADLAAEVFNLRQELDDVFRSYDQARGMLGPGIARALKDDTAAVAKHADELKQLRGVYEDTMGRADALIPVLQNAGLMMQALGYGEKAQEIFAMAERMRELTDGMHDGTVEAAEYEQEMALLLFTARDTFAELKAVGETNFEPAIGGVGGLIQVLGQAIIRARELRAELPGASPEPKYDSPIGPTRPPAPEIPRPKTRPKDIDFGYRPPKAGGKRGGGGGAARISDFARLVERTREEIAKLEAEAVSLTLVAQGGTEFGDALEYARKRAELLYEAQKAGKKMTPALRAEIDQLAVSYTKAGEAAADAAEKLEMAERFAERGAETLTDLFMGIIDRSTSAREALVGLLKEMGRIQIQKGLLDIANSGTGFGNVIQMIGQSLTSYDGGGFTGTGPRSGGVDGKGGFPAILHPNETVVDHTKGGSQTNGGASPQDVNINVNVAGARGNMEVQEMVAAGVRQGISQYDQSLPSRMRQIKADPRRI